MLRMNTLATFLVSFILPILIDLLASIRTGLTLCGKQRSVLFSKMCIELSLSITTALWW
jgi:hypothetical protein